MIREQGINRGVSHMSNFVFDPSRRLFLQSNAFATVASLLPTATFAQSQPIRLGALVPLAGAGGSYGVPIAKVAKAVIDEVNVGGGIKWRQRQLCGAEYQHDRRGARRQSRKRH